jgi:protein arginine N-methyltransferase 1
MSGDKMEVELAEQKISSMDHSEQHYFKRLVLSSWYSYWL